MKTSSMHPTQAGFSLVEVVLAIGVLSLAIVALLGLFGPTIGSVKNVMDSGHATGAVSRINTQIARNMSFGNVQTYTPASGGPIFYVWKRQAAPTPANPNPPIEFVMSNPGSLDGLHNGNSYDLSDDLDGDFSDGYIIDAPLAVTFQRSSVNDYDYGSADEEGYIPVLIKIYAAEPSLVGSYTFAQLEDLDPVFTYTHAKTRSL